MTLLYRARWAGYYRLSSPSRPVRETRDGPDQGAVASDQWRCRRPPATPETAQHPQRTKGGDGPPETNSGSRTLIRPCIVPRCHDPGRETAIGSGDRFLLGLVGTQSTRWGAAIPAGFPVSRPLSACRTGHGPCVWSPQLWALAPCPNPATATVSRRSRGPPARPATLWQGVPSLIFRRSPGQTKTPPLRGAITTSSAA